MGVRVLVTGATGFVGSHVVHRCLADGHTVSVLVRDPNRMERLADIRDRITIHQADICDENAVVRVVQAVRPEWIFHMANAPLIAGVSVSDAQMFSTNTLGLMHLLAACKQVPVTAFINGGSSAEYGQTSVAMTETMLCVPRTPYAVSKLAATTYASMVGKSDGFPIVTFRLFSPFGPEDASERFLPRLIRACQSNTALAIAPDAQRDYIPVAVAVDMMVRAAGMITPAHAGEIYNLGTGQSCTMRDLVAQVATVTQGAPLVTWDPAQERSWASPVWYADMTKTSTAFGPLAPYSFVDALREMLVSAQTA